MLRAILASHAKEVTVKVGQRCGRVGVFVVFFCLKSFLFCAFSCLRRNKTVFFFCFHVFLDLFPGLAFSSDVLAKFGLSNRPLSVFFFFGAS